MNEHSNGARAYPTTELRLGSLWGLIGVLVLSWATEVSAQGLLLESGVISQGGQNSEEVQHFLKEVTQLLPPSFLSRLPRTVRVHFDLNRENVAPLSPIEEEGETADVVLANIEYGPYRDSPERVQDIHLDWRFARGLDDEGLRRLATRSLLHELVHVYDLANLRGTKAERDEAKKCMNNPVYKQRHFSRCLELLRSTTLSETYEYLDTAGFLETGFIFHSRPHSNTDQLRSPNVYEFTDPQEHLAVNFEYFILDPEYALRRPTMANLLSRHFRFTPAKSLVRAAPTVRALSSKDVDPAIERVPLDPEKIYEVRYLLAGKGESWISNWGHSMFQIIGCDPRRERAGPECLDDVPFHVVLSFRANPTDFVPGLLKGITGAYPSLPFIFSMGHIYTEYTEEQFREIASIPIRFSPNPSVNEERKRLFVQKMLEYNWQYSGRYRFITNNCATESLNFLKSLIPESRVQDIRPVFWITPVGLLEELAEAGVLDTTVLEDKKRAEELGYYFPSKKPIYEELLSNIKKSVPEAQGLTLEQYVDETGGKDRMLWSIRHPNLGAEFIALEDYILNQRAKELQEAVISVLLEGEYPGVSDGEIAIIREKAEQLMRLEQELLPARQPEKGYGIPLPEDFSVQKDKALLMRREEAAGLYLEVQRWANRALASRVAKVTEARVNRIWFKLQLQKKATPWNLLRGVGSEFFPRGSR